MIAPDGNAFHVRRTNQRTNERLDEGRKERSIPEDDDEYPAVPQWQWEEANHLEDASKPGCSRGPFLPRQGQPLYSSKYRNDRSLVRATKHDQSNAQPLTTSNYVIAEELLTGLDGPAARHSVTFRPFYEALSGGSLSSAFSPSPSSHSSISTMKIQRRPVLRVPRLASGPTVPVSLSRDIPTFESRWTRQLFAP